MGQGRNGWLRTRRIELDAADLIEREQFFYANCLVIGPAEILGSELINNKIEMDRAAQIDTSDLTEVFGNFQSEIDGAVYSGGEATAHGSCGFFCKKTEGRLDWALMSLDSEPFVDVECSGGDIRFLSGSGSVWVVEGGDITRIHIEPASHHRA